YRYGNYLGKVYVFHASNAGSGITATTSSSGAGGPNATITGIASNTEFSFGLAAADLNGDGYADVLAGAVVNGGGAFVFNASNTGGGITATTAVTGAGGPSAAITGEGSGDFFGESVQ
ncbi:MAG TPA: hypothetical protein VL359_09140, partial [bacterium]|nr:hypothetical protein [bacterium]